ncbi:alpha/beta hydrolase family protein [Hoyosella altamirensis]|uniref:Peptidase S9 prolyl oligopeptidase catalytic domain-containing protein n=1 Tax=Hoyosella altamirensis TaxID=616997 RepID=A0A839RQH1_9ACTN|nr:hypothetical protein [Hoyosella altamirensis]MBB3039035.1 hypothetical protein [Hoyosella altamirensis]
MNLQRGIAAGVPYVAKPPISGAAENAPVVFGWHLMDSPRSEVAFEAAVPMEGLDAWRIYLGLPLCGSRMPAGGFDEIMQLGMEDAVLNLHGPIADQAVREFADVYPLLREKFGFGDAALGVMGGSLGAAIASLIIAERVMPVRAAVLVSPLLQLRAVVAAMSRVYGIDYEWTPEANRVADRLDFVARASDFARAGTPPVRAIVGADDETDGFIEPAENFIGAVRSVYNGTPTDLQFVDNMAHALADEPGLEATPQLPHASKVDALTVEWFTQHLR